MTVAAKPKPTATAAPAAEVRELLTPDVAQARGLVPVGHVWDPDTQQPVPRGDALMTAALERPVDLARNLEAYKQNRATLVQFIERSLHEARYNEKKYPLPGEMHDYYKLPGYDKKVLTKQGAEKVAQLFRFARATTETVHREISKECVVTVVRVVLIDHYRRQVGSGEAACSTAESSFQNASKKYGGDMRAALNDVISKAGKRAFVQAVVYAVAGDELFETQPTAVGEQDDDDVRREAAEAKAPAAAGARFPEKFGSVGGKLIADVDTEELARIATWCRTKAKEPAKQVRLLAAIDEELERRRQSADDEAYPG